MLPRFGCINRCTGYSVVFFPAPAVPFLRQGAFVNLHRQFSFASFGHVLLHIVQASRAHVI